MKMDFGFASRYLDPDTNQHKKMMKHGSCLGTPRYASLNVHKGYSLSRRDDLESVAYMLIFFMRGTLPWSGLVLKKNENRWAVILEVGVCVFCVSCFLFDVSGSPPLVVVFLLIVLVLLLEQVKQRVVIQDLCRNLPPQFARFLEYTRNLGFAEDPDYSYMKGLFTDLLAEMKCHQTHIFNW
jgi:serine/threonine protein kinase